MSIRERLRTSHFVVLNRAGRIKYLQFSYAITTEEFFIDLNFYFSDTSFQVPSFCFLKTNKKHPIFVLRRIMMLFVFGACHP